MRNFKKEQLTPEEAAFFDNCSRGYVVDQKMSHLVGTNVAFSTLKGHKILKIKIIDEAVLIYTNTGLFILLHRQDCCEHVYVQDVSGLDETCIGEVVSSAVASTSNTESDDDESDDDDDPDGIQQWTFYNIRTPQNEIQIRFYGSSNGYYGVGVDTFFLAAADMEPTDAA